MGGGRKGQHPDLIDQSVNHMQGMANRTKEYIFLLDEEMEIPYGLTKGAKSIFKETIDKYNRLYQQTGVKIVCNLDSTILRSYCNYHDILDRLYKELNKTSSVFVDEVRKNKKKKHKDGCEEEGDTTESTKQVINPVYAEIRKVEQRLTTLADKLYLTPMGRVATANLQTRKKKNNFDTFMSEIE